eukprot:67203_1
MGNETSNNKDDKDSQEPTDDDIAKKQEKRKGNMFAAIMAAKRKAKKQGGGGKIHIGSIGKAKDDKDSQKSDGILLNKKFKYIYGKRQCSYRSEQMEMSPKETEKVKKLLQKQAIKYEPYKQILSISKKKPIKIIIDTDIGTDIDDVFALLLFCHLPKTDVELLGVTTNYRPTVLRKHIAESILQQTKQNDNDLSDIPVIAGNCHLCGTHRPFFYAGNEGKGLGLNENDDQLMKQYWQNSNSADAETFIYEQICKYPKEVTIVSIGIPTNIGNLVHKYGKDKIEALVGHLVVMGGGSIMDRKAGVIQQGIGNYYGKDQKKWKTKYDRQTEEIKVEFDLPNDSVQAMQWITASDEKEDESSARDKVIHLFPNHNLSGDTLASMMMFELKCPISIIPHHITRQHWLKGRAIETLLSLATKSDLNKKIYEDNENGLCGALMREWFRVRSGQRGQCLHDPLTLYEAIYCQTAGSERRQKEDQQEDEKGNDFELGKDSCLRYCNGTIVVHEWAAFITFVPDPYGPHRFAYKCINPQKWVEWCGDTMINNVSKENVTDNAGHYKTLMNTFAAK